MKKFILSLFIAFFVCAYSYAASYEPQYTEKVNRYSTGVYELKEKTTVYQEPSETSEVFDTIEVDKIREKVKTQSGLTGLHNTFITFSTDKDLYFITVIDESDSWVKICYDNKTGWVKSDSNYLIWKEFFFRYGKENGLYFFRNTSSDNMVLRQKPEDTSKKIASYDYARPVFLKFIRGNWALAGMNDFGEESYTIGWVKWRNQDGSFILFPHI